VNVATEDTMGPDGRSEPNCHPAFINVNFPAGVGKVVQAEVRDRP
jgi:hypothetical protein